MAGKKRENGKISLMISQKTGGSMGGYGSGRGRWGQDTTSSYLQLDVRRWQRERLLEPGHYFNRQWLVNGEAVASISVRIQPGRVVLSYKHRRNDEDAWQSKEYPVWLDWTYCNYGGRRPWFLCPARGCGRRVAILHGGSIFACRHCYHLAYDSQREPPHDRALMRAQRIRIKLGGSGSLNEPFPAKPKGMHWRTYERLRVEADHASDRSCPPQILKMLHSRM